MIKVTLITQQAYKLANAVGYSTIYTKYFTLGSRVSPVGKQLASLSVFGRYEDVFTSND
jgi:hypothetical protein